MPDRHDYQLFLAINDIEHTRTKVKSPQTNGICERFHKTILQEFYQVAFRKKIYETIEQLQIDLDLWIDYYNNERTHQGQSLRRQDAHADPARRQSYLEGKVCRPNMT